MFAKQGCDRKAYKKVKVLLTLHFWFFSRSDPDRCDKRYGYVIYIHICIIYTMYIFYYIYHMWMYIVFFCVNTSLIHDTWIICIPDFSKGEFIGSPSWKRRAITVKGHIKGISWGYHGDIMGIYQGDISWGYQGISWGYIKGIYHGDIKGISWDFMGISWGYHGDIMGIYHGDLPEDRMRKSG